MEKIRDSSGRFSRREHFSEEELRLLYVDKNLSMSQISRLGGGSHTTIFRDLAKYQIPRKPFKVYGPNSGSIRRGEHRSPNTELKKGLTPKHRRIFLGRAEFEELYLSQRLSTLEIAEKLGITAKTVQVWLKQYNIPRRSLKEARQLASDRGKINFQNHPLWKGGGLLYYGSNWIQQRRRARERDQTCQFQGCTITPEQQRKELDVHHITPFRHFGIDRYEEANDLNNLICYCRKHHLVMEVR